MAPADAPASGVCVVKCPARSKLSMTPKWYGSKSPPGEKEKPSCCCCCVCGGTAVDVVVGNFMMMAMNMSGHYNTVPLLVPSSSDVGNDA
eukprot:scaffold2716_cov179-Amphora_coffeaeformis.AAC.16